MLLYTGKVSIREQQQSLKGICLYYIVRLIFHSYEIVFLSETKRGEVGHSSWLMIAAKVISICWSLM